MSGSSFSVGSILGIGSSANTNPILELRNLQQRISRSPALSRNDLATRTRLTAERNALNERSSLFSSLKTEIEKLNTLANGLNTAKLIEKSGGTKLAQVTSSNTSVISAKVSGDVAGGTFGINVSRLASAASISGGSINDIFRSRQLSDVLSVRNANFQQSQAATYASLQSGSVQDIYRSRDLGDLNSIQNANVRQSQTAAAASVQSGSIEDIYRSRDLGDLNSVQNANVRETQIAAAASLQGGSVEDIYWSRDLGDLNSVQNANVIQTQTASAASLQGAAIEDIFTAQELSVAAAVKSSTSAGVNQTGVAASLTGKNLGTVDAVEVLGDTFNVASAGQDAGTGTSGLRQAVCNILSFARPRLTFSKISVALAVHTKGFGAAL